MVSGSEKIEIDSFDTIQKRYKIRRSGRRNGSSIETTIPPEAFAREARRRGMTPEEAVNELVAVWHYNSFPGIHLRFEKKEA